MSTSSLTVGMLSGLTGEQNNPSPRAKPDTTSTTSTTSATSNSAALETMSAELRFASVNWDREKRQRFVDPRRTVDVPLTAQDKFRSIPWDPAEHALPDPVFTEEDVKTAEERSKKMSVGEFFKAAKW